MPQSVMSSVYHEFTDRLALLANLGWQDWSQFGYVDIGVHSIDSTDITADLDFQDTWHVALGVQYRLSEPWLLPGGVAYDSTIYDGDEVSPALPVDENWRFDIGSNYDWSKDLTLGAAYELAWGGDLDVDVDRGPLVGELSGSYENLAIHIICLNAEWRL